MSEYFIILIIIGLSGLTMAWLPGKLYLLPLSYPIIFIAAGAVLYKLDGNLPQLFSEDHEDLNLRIVEISVIVSLMGTGLKIDTPLKWRSWQVPFRLIGITMLLCIASLAFFGWWLLSFSIASALLLGAALAPTDPVLASDVQVGPPNEKEEDHVRFSLTAEAGLNDGMAFPFVWLAILLAGESLGSENFVHWLWKDFFYRIIVGVFCGYLSGKLFSYVFFELPKRDSKFPKIRESFAALAATFVVYGLTELIQGYGFLAVFFAGLAMRRRERHHQYHKEMHNFMDQLERFLLVIILLPFGGALATGLLSDLTWNGALVALIFIFLIRPVSGMLAMIGIKTTNREKFSISFLGIRGVGSFFYLSYAMKNAFFPEQKELWAVCGFIVLISIIIHGISATPLMKYLDSKRRRI